MKLTLNSCFFPHFLLWEKLKSLTMTEYSLAVNQQMFVYVTSLPLQV